MKQEIEKIAEIHTEFPDKFGIPRQSGLVWELQGVIQFEPKFRNRDALRGIEEFSHLWLLWGFSKANQHGFVPTVAPPRLGGKIRKGVFATRSPFRPNSIGLSCVRLKEVCLGTPKGPLLIVEGADMLDGTPIYDIKPYLPYTDAHPEAAGSFGEEHCQEQIQVVFPEELLCRLPVDRQKSALAVLSQDPRAAYQKKPDSIYGMAFAGYDIRFKVVDRTLIVCDVVRMQADEWSKLK